jgi:hypothetical protein
MEAKTVSVPVKKKYSKEDLISFIKESFPVPAKNTLRICPLWTDHLYRLNFWGSEDQGIIKSYFIEVKETLDGLIIKNYDKEDVENN